MIVFSLGFNLDAFTATLPEVGFGNMFTEVCVEFNSATALASSYAVPPTINTTINLGGFNDVFPGTFPPVVKLYPLGDNELYFAI